MALWVYALHSTRLWMVDRGKVKFILCIAGDYVGLCQVANQQGRGLLLSSKVACVPATEKDRGNWLRDSLKEFEPKQLKRVCDVAISTALIEYIPLENFCIREENFIRSAVFELENVLGESSSGFKFGFYRSGERNLTHAFLVSKELLAQLNVVLKEFGIKKPRILAAPIMFVEAAKQQLVKSDTIFIYVGRNVVSTVARKNADAGVALIPIQLEQLGENISKAINRVLTVSEVYNLLSEASKKNINPKIQALFDQFFKELNSKILEKSNELCGEVDDVNWVVGGSDEATYDIAKRLVTEHAIKVMPYNVFFRQQISAAVGADTLEKIEPFVPALMSAATLDDKKIKEAVNFQTDVQIVSAHEGKSEIYQKLVTALVCVVTFLLYYSQELSCQKAEVDARGKKILAQKESLSRIARQIEVVQKQVDEKEKMLGDILLPVYQSRAWCEFFNQLKDIADDAGDVYFASLVWGVQVPKKQSEDRLKVVKGSAKQTVGSVNDMPSATSSVQLAGTMYLGSAELVIDGKNGANDTFNRMFDRIRALPLASDLVGIRVNAPENGKITFRATVVVNPRASIMAL